MADSEQFHPSPPATAVIIGRPFAPPADAVIVAPGDSRIRWDRHGQPYLVRQPLTPRSPTMTHPNVDEDLGVAILTRVAERLSAELAVAERKALQALAGYKFVMFGYHAAQWVLLNRVEGGGRPNPFRILVHAARQELKP